MRKSGKPNPQRTTKERWPAPTIVSYAGDGGNVIEYTLKAGERVHFITADGTAIEVTQDDDGLIQVISDSTMMVRPRYSNLIVIQ